MPTRTLRENLESEPGAINTPMSDEADVGDREPKWVVDNIVIDTKGEEYVVVDVDWANGHIGKVSLRRANVGSANKEFEVLPRKFSQYSLKKSDGQEGETLP